MKIQTTCLAIILAGCVGISAATGPQQATVAPTISPAQAAVLAVNRLKPSADGVVLRHPRRTVEFAPEGVRLTSRRGAPEWRWSLEALGRRRPLDR